MSLNKTLVNKDEIYKITSFAFNCLLVVALIFISVYLAASLFGGKLLLNAIIHYASWLVIALAGKYVLRRALKGQRIRGYDYSLVCLATIVNLVIWFSYPVNIILSVLCIVGIVLSYKAQDRRLRQEQEGICSK